MFESFVPKIVTEVICGYTGQGHKWKHVGQQFVLQNRVAGKKIYVLQDKSTCIECKRVEFKPIETGDK